MLKKIMGLLLCMFLLVSFAWADLSSPKMSNEEYRQYLKESNDFATADKGINHIYNQLKSILGEYENNALQDEQMRWTIMRDTKAFSEGEKGSQVYIDSLVKLTNERKAELESRILKLKQESAASEVSEASPMPPPQIEDKSPQQQAKPLVNNVTESKPSGSVASSDGTFSSFLLMMGIIFFMFYLLIYRPMKKKKRLQIDYLSHISDFTETQKIMGVDGLVGLAVDEQRKKVCLIDYSQKQFRTISYKDLLSSEVFEDGATITKTMRGSQIAGALIGNIAFGGVGAIIGGLSGKTKSTGTVSKIDLRLTVNDTKRPIFDITFLNKETKKDKPVYQQALQTARQCHGLVEVLIKRADMDDKLQAQSANAAMMQQTGQQMSVADELKKLSDLKDSGALTAEEYQQQKRKLIG